MQALVAGDRDRFVAAELAGRAAAGMPPYGRLASLIVSGPDPAAVDNVCAALARRAPQQDGRHGARALGRAARAAARPPPPAVSAQDRRAISQCSRCCTPGWREIGLPGSVRLQIDVDPYSFL